MGNKPVSASMDAAIRSYVYRKHGDDVESITIEGDDDRSANVAVVLKPPKSLTITFRLDAQDEGSA